MLDPRWRKVLGDLWQYRVRTVLIVLTVALGALSVGVVVMINAILMPDSINQYRLRNPEQIRINLSKPVDDAMLSTVRSINGVSRAESRVKMTARIQLASAEYGNAMLIAIPPISEMQINQLRMADGSARLPDLALGEMFIERSSREAIGVIPDGNINVKIGGSEIKTLRLSAYVHDLSVWPYSFEPDIVAYVSVETLEQLASSGVSISPWIAITTEKTNADKAYLDQLAQNIIKATSSPGFTVDSVELFTSGDFFAAQSLQIFQIILLSLGVLAALLGASLIINNLTALLDQQVRQIAVMKTIGGTQGQIALVYFALVISYGLLAAVLAFPMAALGGYQVCRTIAALINIDMFGFRFPFEVTLSLVLSSIALPIIAALGPITHGLRQTVREALNHYGVSSSEFQLLGWLTEQLRFLPNHLAMSLRNVFRRRTRLLLTLSALALGGACLISIFNLRSAITSAIDYAMQCLKVDVILTLDRPVNTDKLESVANKIQGVEAAEGWGFTPAQFYAPGSITDSRRVLLLAPPPDSTMTPPDVDPKIFSGENENGVIITNQMLDRYPGLKIGDIVKIKIRERLVDFRIIRVYHMVGRPTDPSLFVSYTYLNKLLDGPDQVHDLRLRVSAQNIDGQNAAANAVSEKLFETLGLNVTEINLGASLESSFSEPAEIILLFLFVMASLVVIVGGLGLTGTIHLNVQERQREIGILRAIGAENFDVLWIVVIEALTMGILGWLLAVVFSIPITALMNNVIGSILLGTPLPIVFDPLGAIIWLGGTLLLAVLASVQPALYATSLTVREVLAYE